MYDPYEDSILEKNKIEVELEKKKNLRMFINRHESEKQNILDKDKYYMLMQLVESGYLNEINKLSERDKNDKEYLYIINRKWKLIKKHINVLWNTCTDDNKYQIIINKITSINLWNSCFINSMLNDTNNKDLSMNENDNIDLNINANDNDNDKNKNDNENNYFQMICETNPENVENGIKDIFEDV